MSPDADVVEADDMDNPRPAVVRGLRLLIAVLTVGGPGLMMAVPVVSPIPFKRIAIVGLTMLAAANYLRCALLREKLGDGAFVPKRPFG
ncbi:MAG: hypothetical protein ABEI99_01735 [Halobaculum sp.]